MLLPEVQITVAVFIAAVATVAAMIGIERRKRTDFQPSLVPTTPILLLAGLVALLALVHLANIYGIQTGR